jgi:hypothetical protein
MKKIFLISIALVWALFANAQSNTSDPNAPEMEFEKAAHDFGDIIQDDKVSYNFKFTNTGKTPLIINDVITTCGCTVPTWPKEPIPPGGKGEISATFSSAGKMGKQNKTITVMSNAANSPARVNIICNILPKGGDAMKAGNAPTPAPAQPKK